MDYEVTKMIPLTVSTPLSSFLEAYDLAKKTLREAGYVDTNSLSKQQTVEWLI